MNRITEITTEVWTSDSGVPFGRQYRIDFGFAGNEL